MVAAAVYNGLWGLGVVVFAGPVAWKCVGMLVACYAPGYWWAARRPLPEIVAIGLLGKILGPIGFVWAAATGRLPLRDPGERRRLVACIRRLSPQILEHRRASSGAAYNGGAWRFRPSPRIG
jgi:hypothetical protein